MADEHGHITYGPALDMGDVDAQALATSLDFQLRTRRLVTLPSRLSSDLRRLNALEDLKAMVDKLEPGETMMIEAHDPAVARDGRCYTATKPISPIIQAALDELALQLRVDEHMRVIEQKLAGVR